MRLRQRCDQFNALHSQISAQGINPYFRPIAKSWGAEVEIAGQRLVMIGSNDYLGFSHDPRVMDASAKAVYQWGTGPGGSRFLSGNMVLHHLLEERLAAFVGKRNAVVHVTGFSTNLGVLGVLVMPSDTVLCDRENHASIFEGVKNTKARLATFAHNDAAHALARVEAIKANRPDNDLFLVTEGVFSMSGELAPLDAIAAVKDAHPDVIFYLDDAHGLGVFGRGGRGSADHFRITDKVDFIMGTFSKSMASIGGFIASDDEDMLRYLRYQSRTQIFSAALPAANTVAVLTCLDILEREPERVDRLHEVTGRMRQAYKSIGLRIGASSSPIIPIIIGSDEKAFQFSQALFEAGVFALPAVYPAVPRGQALIRTAYMSTHQDRQLDFVLDVLEKLAKQFRIRECDLDDEPTYAAGDEEGEAGAKAKMSYL
ncbi:aminotransferase class I/II-fold pyridoxal phosphate-dependent enzyme [Desulfovibrio sp. TomC]|uniref:aminotransferase class I/II-fold pyridoxal phosphate-dependent enzyme n=1 Tax=Desulfovibrio sp. TomC TaxID=1562888 RepID=UPI0005757E8A|nr:aminotransferase class I/II-fold pyridoxal phosphate-dependent enzyme [Desulfovibrio sp. TomC]KHK01398.1 8-amino-7-oxononanoate synthase [Desulfovibrio sp. TomC]